MKRIKNIRASAIQIAGLFALNQAGQAIAASLHAPVPGNVIGLLLLLVLLWSGLVPLDLVENGAGLLTRHLAFFFVPLAVDLMGLTGFTFGDGAALLLVLLGSALAGICIAGGLA